MPCGITQCFPPPGNGDVSAFTPAEADSLVLYLATPDLCKVKWTRVMVISLDNLFAKYSQMSQK